MKILLVDDEVTIQNVLSSLFERKGFQVNIANSGLEALGIARREKPDLIISDIMMPDMDGFQFRRAILDDETLRDVPFVFYSGKYVDEKSERLAESLGVSRFISKPMNNKEFFASIEQVLDEHNEKKLSPRQHREYQNDKFAESYQGVLFDRVLKTNHELETAHKSQQVINNLLHLSLQDLTLEELLDRLLEQVISFPWYDLMSKGAIFIAQGKELVLMAERGMHSSLLKECGRLPFGRCLCGRCAESGEVVFADHVDDRHDVLYPGIEPHGHYCVPIKTGSGDLLGVFTLYIKAGTLRRTDIEGSLKAAAQTAASIIMRKIKDEQLIRHYEELHALNKASSDLLFRDQKKDSLLLYICKIARESFKLKMVWLGFLKDENRVEVAAAFGEGTEYLDSIMLQCDNPNEAKGPTCQAIKTGKPLACNDIENDQIFTPWRDKALGFGFRSSLAVPMIDLDKGSQGTLNMYSGEKDFFSPERIELLTAYVNNVVSILSLDKLVANLEDKVQERTIELESARNLAEAADRAKSSFLANMSHELRTPLNSIIGFSDIMLQGITGEIASDQREYLNDILDSGKHLLSLVNDILDLSKIEADMIELDYGEFEFEDILERCLFLVREKALKHQISITTEIQKDLPPVNIDERRIRQVIVNLLSNAVKFSPDGGEIRIVAKFQHDSESVPGKQSIADGYVIVSVSDTGAGIAAEDQAKLFKPFVQLQSRTSGEFEGTGLGLALSKRIVEQHNGRIFLASEPGQGSVFSFVVPVQQPTELRKFPSAFLPWEIFIQHLERIVSLTSRLEATFLVLRLKLDEGDSEIDWNEIVLAFTGKIRAHECFSCEPAGGSMYFLLMCENDIVPESAFKRFTDILEGLGVASVFHQAKYPEDGDTPIKLLRILGYRGNDEN